MAMASAGLPGFANFASELLVIVGSWNAEYKLAGTGITMRYIPTIAAVWGLVVSGVYLLRAVRDAWFGPANPRWEGLKDAVTATQKFPFILLIVVLTYTGCFPGRLVDTIESGVRSVLVRVDEAAVAAREAEAEKSEEVGEASGEAGK